MLPVSSGLETVTLNIIGGDLLDWRRMDGLRYSSWRENWFFRSMKI